ncbi:MAG: SDR family oxidoreductase [Isosphaeraceae bacterium]|nr:SDR family oxidoreductase [Isosphaeraceae bacterium]
MGRLEGRNCLVVGGTGGIGRAIVARFLGEGGRVIATGRDSAEIQAFHADLPGSTALVLDARDEQGVESVFRHCERAFGGRLDVLVHVAGISGRAFGDAPLDSCTLDGWRTVFDVNAQGPFLTNRAAVRRMLGQPLDDSGVRGAVVNVGSVLAWSPSPERFGTIAYAASKAAVQALTLASASRYARDRIRFNLLAPGLIDTPMARRAVGDPAILSYLAVKQPMASGPGSPQDCAEAALFLCEPANRLLTGVVLEVSGGWSITEGLR